MSFADCENLISKYAPLFLREGLKLEEKTDNRILGVYRRPIPLKTIDQMKQLKARGMTIGEIAIKTDVSWRTAWKHSKPKKGEAK